MPWVRAGSVGSLAAGELGRFEAGGHEYLLARLDEHTWQAADLLCTHASADLDTTGVLIEGRLTCFSHGATFDLHEGGAAVIGPATRALRLFPTRIDGADVLADIPEKDLPPPPDK